MGPPRSRPGQLIGRAAGGGCTAGRGVDAAVPGAPCWPDSQPMATRRLSSVLGVGFHPPPPRGGEGGSSTDHPHHSTTGKLTPAEDEAAGRVTTKLRDTQPGRASGSIDTDTDVRD